MEWVSKLRVFILEGGWGMVPLELLGVVVLAVAIERACATFARRPDAEALLARARGAVCVGDRDVSLALRLCARADEPACRVLRAGLLAADAPREHRHAALALALSRERVLLERRTPYLPAFGNIAMCTGLLGTLSGLIFPFHWGCGSGAPCDPGCRAALIALSLSEAMHCNAAGLFVAIVAVAAHAVLSVRAGALSAELALVAQVTRNMLDERRLALDTPASDLAAGLEAP